MSNQEDNLVVDEERNVRAERFKSMLEQEEQETENKNSENTLQEPSKVYLRTAWLSMGTLLAIPFSLLYINLHAFMRFIFPQFFCRLGSEWVPKGAGRMLGSNANNNFFLLESITLAFINLFVLFIIGALFVVFVSFIDAMAHPLSTLFSFAKSALKSFFGIE